MVFSPTIWYKQEIKLNYYFGLAYIKYEPFIKHLVNEFPPEANDLASFNNFAAI